MFELTFCKYTTLAHLQHLEAIPPHFIAHFCIPWAAMVKLCSGGTCASLNTANFTSWL